MSPTGTLISFYPSEQTAQDALKRLRSWRFRRVALIKRSSEGSLQTTETALYHRVLTGFFLGTALSLSLGLVVFFYGFKSLTAIYLVLLSFIVFGAVSALATPALSRVLRFGVDRQILEKYARCLVRGENVLVIQASPAIMGRAISLLRRISKDQPAIFAFHPHRKPVLIERDSSAGEPLTYIRIRDHVRTLAQGHKIRRASGIKTPLLKHIHNCGRIIEEVHQVLAEASHLEQKITTSAEWILDNAFIIHGQISDVGKNLPKKFYRELPILEGGRHDSRPRVYGIADALVLHTEGQVDQHSISDFLEAYQSISPLTIGELWAFPLMLRISLIDNLCHLAEKIDRQLREREIADFWANRLIVVTRNEPDLLFPILTEFIKEIPEPSVHFAFQMLEHLYDEEAALKPVQAWLERKIGGNIEAALFDEKASQSSDEVSIGNTITSLRLLKQIDWRDIFEDQSRVERHLRNDPADVYTMMDFATRNSYRQSVEAIAKAGGWTEEEVARTAISLATKRAESAPGDRRHSHVGYFLIDKGRPKLTKLLQTRANRRYRLFSWIYAHHSAIYLGGICISTLLIILLLYLFSAARYISTSHLVLLVLLGIIPAARVSIQVINFIITHLMPVRNLPKMDFERRGIPGECQTLIVVPTLLTNRSDIRSDVENLEIRYQANPDPNLIFALFTDFTDADKPKMDDDEALLRIAILGIGQLNMRYGVDKFYLFHREREWVESESCYMGWERKRGKLEDLNRFLNGVQPRFEQEFVRVGDPSRLRNVRFVITLDNDTQLPRGSARRMIETMAHPLNEPDIDPKTGLVWDGFTIIQPRITTSLPSATATPFSSLFTDPVGTDPYTNAVSEIYQDLSGEGSYQGKGIYDPRIFHRVLTGRFRERNLLSHDLIEGAYVRVGLASDIELYDDFPPDYISYTTRQHRWTRGDWQICDWLLPWVVDSKGRRSVNPLSILNRWKIIDNLRRSLDPPITLAFLLAAWQAPSPVASAASALVGLNLLWSPLADMLNWFLPLRRIERTMIGQITRNLTRSLVEISFMVHQAYISIDAICRVWYRRLISKQNMLQWTTARSVQKSSDHRRSKLVLFMFAVSALSLLKGAFLWGNTPGTFTVALPFLLLWSASPYLFWRLGQRWRPPREISQQERKFLRVVARRTWRTFDDFVGPETNWLPSDNYQVSHIDELAQRTSPTNIGFYLLSLLAASDFGFLAPDEVVERLNRSFESLESLQRYEGHLLNWYNIDTLEPLNPQYVSTVDSGNLIGSLWTLSQGVRELIDSPILDYQTLRGINDTAAILFEEMTRAGVSGDPVRKVKELSETTANTNSTRLMDIIRCVRRAAESSGKILEDLEVLPEIEQREPGVRKPDEKHPPKAEILYWAQKLHRQAQNWSLLIERYIGWIEELSLLTDTEMQNVLGSEARAEFDGINRRAPSLRQIAQQNHPLMQIINTRAARNSASGQPDGPAVRISVLLASNAVQAAELVQKANLSIEKSDEVADGVKMNFLYNRRKRLFHIGYSVTDQSFDNSYYDLFASEARLASFIAIAKSDVPVDHWLALGRAHGSVGRRRILLSWGGTMFEYLMPQLLLRTYRNSFLSMACQEAVSLQIHYGQQKGVPWGISESAYADLDASSVYQYSSFGVPGLGLKRGLEDDLVVAPYATLLALPFRPRKALDNLHRLSKTGLLASHGFFESIDFTRQRRPEGDTGVIVRTYMTHHQGMGFLALDNYLNRSPMQRRFHKNVRVRAAEPLLFEKIPALPPVYPVPTKERAPSSVTPVEILPSESKFNTPHTAKPKTQLLSNGRYSVLVTNSGGGYSRWEDLDITRWRVDTTRDNWGLFCYIQDLSKGRTWSNAYQPVCGKMDNYVVSLALDRAEIRRSDGGVETETEVFVCTEDDVEIRRISLINRSGEKRELQVTSYIELALADHWADLMHQSFNSLFIRTEMIQEGNVLLATRRKRSPEEPNIWLCHLMTVNTPAEGPVQYETSREKFIGRGRTPADPQVLEQDLSGTIGHVLDPILSLRRKVILKPGQQATLSLILGAAGTKEQVLRIVDKYEHPETPQREKDLVWRQAQLELRHLRIQPEEARRFQHLANYMVYPSDQLRPPAVRLMQNTYGKSRLWRYGISGDLPIMIVTIGDPHDISLVTQALQAHTYWRRHGLKSDLVILNEEASSYDQLLHGQLLRLIHNFSHHTGTDTPGGIYLRFTDQIPEEDLTLMLAVANILLVAVRGPLAQQLGTPALKAELPPESPAGIGETFGPSSALPHVNLVFRSKTGGFTEDGSEYVINLESGIDTPSPWVNVLSNPVFGCLISEIGSGFTWRENSQRNRLTTWTNDPVSDPVSEAIYIKDVNTGQFWTPTPLPIRGQGMYRVHHGQGYSRFIHNCQGINQEMTVFVPMDEGGGDPVKIQRLRLKNETGTSRRLSIMYYAEWVLGENRERSQMHVVTSWENKVKTMMATNLCNEDFQEYVAFASISPNPDSYTGDREEFLGRNSQPAQPAAIGRTNLSDKTGAGLDPCSAIQITVELDSGQEKDVICILGQAESKQEVVELAKHYRNPENVEESLNTTIRWWQDTLGRVSVSTPLPAVDIMLNRWLPYQTLSCRLWGRSGLYQSGGAFGYRDQLQDVLALLNIDPGLAREHILLAASRQFREGDVQHWWHPPSGAGIRSRCSDDLLWLPYAVCTYIQHSGDIHILDESVPYLEGDTLGEEDEIYMVPNVSLEQTSLYEHCIRAVHRGLTSGSHGLPLMGIGDWNDGMNRIGIQGAGESVWLAWFLNVVLEGMADLAEKTGREKDAGKFRKKAKQLITAIDKHAWDGEWYRRAYYDDGQPLGSSSGNEAKIDSIAQSWSVISGKADHERAKRAVESAWKYLVIEQDGLALLLTPPFDQGDADPGYIKGYPPGIRENGGQYSHAAMWLAKALAMLGDGERAARLLTMINPINHALDQEGVKRYRTEPYAMAADVYNMDGSVGRGGWTWYTGASGWMYRVWLEDILGLKVFGETLTVDPVIPPEWDVFHIRYRRGKSLYNITVENPDNVSKGIAWCEMNGQRLPDGTIPIEPVSSILEIKHNIVVRMGAVPAPN